MATTPPPGDPTFRVYNTSQAKSYAAGRADYPEALVATVLKVFQEGGGQFSTLVDIGCGPGIATRQLSPYFDRTFGLDPSHNMIETAREHGGKTRSGERIVFDVTGAESMDAKLMSLHVQEGEVDLIIAATAAHWFDLPRFYRAAAKMLRPGGQLIMFCLGGSFVDATRTANADEVQRVLDHFEHVFLRDYGLKGNELCGGLYAELPLPWSTNVAADSEVWDRGEALRVTWNEEANGMETGRPSSLLREYSVEQLRQAIGTASSVSRWREAHREALKDGKLSDCVDDLIFEVQQTLERKEGGPEGPSTELIVARMKAGLIRIRKKALGESQGSETT